MFPVVEPSFSLDQKYGASGLAAPDGIFILYVAAKTSLTAGTRISESKIGKIIKNFTFKVQKNCLMRFTQFIAGDTPQRTRLLHIILNPIHSMMIMIRSKRNPSPKVGEIETFVTACEELTKLDDVCHVAVINRLGRPVARSFKGGINRLLDDEKLAMVYMQLYLDYSMRKELDPILGQIDYITSRRKNLTMISVPIKEYLVLITAERKCDETLIIKQVEKLF